MVHSRQAISPCVTRVYCPRGKVYDMYVVQALYAHAHLCSEHKLCIWMETCSPQILVTRRLLYNHTMVWHVSSDVVTVLGGSLCS